MGLTGEQRAAATSPQTPLTRLFIRSQAPQTSYGFTGYTPIWGRPSIPTRAPITLSELALQANDELCFNLTPPTVSQQYGIDFAGSMQLVCRVAEIENEKDTLLPLVKLRNGVMCRTSTPLFVGE